MRDIGLEYELAEVEVDREMLLFESAIKLEEVDSYYEESSEKKDSIPKRVITKLKQLYEKLKELIKSVFHRNKSKTVYVPKEDAKDLEKAADKCDKVATELSKIGPDDYNAMKKLEKLKVELDTVDMCFKHLKKSKKMDRKEKNAQNMVASGMLNKVDRACERAVGDLADLFNDNEMTDKKYMQKRAAILRRLNAQMKFITLQARSYTKHNEVAKSIYDNYAGRDMEAYQAMVDLTGSAAARAERLKRAQRVEAQKESDAEEVLGKRRGRKSRNLDMDED